MSQEMRDLINFHNKLIKENTTEIDESGYSSIANTFRGLRPSIKSLAILTAENPHGVQHSNEYNKKANKELEIFLREGKFGYKKIKGSYGQVENSFIVFNISYSQSINIGVKFKQDSIIYGRVTKGEGDNIPMSFTMAGTDKTKPKEFKQVLGHTNVFVQRKDATDFYSEINGRQFVLPFFDVVDHLTDPEGKSYMLTKDYSKSEWIGGKNEPTKQKIDYIEDELNELQERAMNTDGSTSYNLRSRILQIINTL
jgi:hypothetical protein